MNSLKIVAGISYPTCHTTSQRSAGLVAYEWPGAQPGGELGDDRQLSLSFALANEY